MLAIRADSSHIWVSKLPLSSAAWTQRVLLCALPLSSLWARNKSVGVPWSWQDPCRGVSFFEREHRRYHKPAVSLLDWRKRRRLVAFDTDIIWSRRGSISTMSIAATLEGGGRQLRRRKETHISLSSATVIASNSVTQPIQSRKKAPKATVSSSSPTDDETDLSNGGATDLEARLWNLDKSNQLSSLTVVELRGLMKHMNKPTAGRKDELISEVKKWLAERHATATKLSKASATRESSSDAESLEGALLKAEAKSRKFEALSRMTENPLAERARTPDKQQLPAKQDLPLAEVDSYTDGEVKSEQKTGTVNARPPEKGSDSDKDFEPTGKKVISVKSRGIKKVVKAEKLRLESVEDDDDQTTNSIVQKRKTKASKGSQAKKGKFDVEVEDAPQVKTKALKNNQAKKGKFDTEVEDASQVETATSTYSSEMLVHKKPQTGWVPYNPDTMRPPPPAPGTKTIKVVSWNVNGLRALMKDKEKKQQEAVILKNFAIKENFDILCLQETKLQEKDVELIRKTLLVEYEDSFWSCSVGKLGYSGTAVLSKIKPLSVTYGLGSLDHDTEGRLITMEFDSFYLLTSYVPNSGEKLARLDYRTLEWDPALRAFIKELETRKPVILTGDLNCANDEIDIYNPDGNRKSAGFTDQERTSFKANFLDQGLVDTFRRKYPNAVGYTYWAYRSGARAKNQGWRLDYFLVSEALVGNIHDSYICPDVLGSDHCPIGLILEL